LRDDFRPDSDMGILVTFAPDTDWGWLDHVQMQPELQRLVPPLRGGRFHRPTAMLEDLVFSIDDS
jgi:hypothetical protein